MVVDLGESFDFEYWEYLFYVNFVFDKFGVLLKYNNVVVCMIYLLIIILKDEGLLLKQGFIYKEVVMDSDDNFVEVIICSFIVLKGEVNCMEFFWYFDQFDDGYYIDVILWEMIQNLFYWIYLVGIEISNGDELDVNVISIYLFEFDWDGNVVWEWDFIDYFLLD